ncbi:SRPBCC domain-containing protein [Candidatus Methylocalor cossyra]|uniref:Activator of Hsp90 ATPase homologue 1/2-like C-terminal domain-containing protein n=1 Tax=Candidatus Methylocalor cossyra TaxID=3108543 RepID=A0ABM9NJS6_9GAMM
MVGGLALRLCHLHSHDPEKKLWQALLEPEFTRQYWFEVWHECQWNPGAPWRLMLPDGRVGYSGEVLEIEPQRRLVLSWRAEFNPEWRAEGYSRVTFELEPQPHSVKLSVIHEIDRPDSQLVGPLS